LQSETLGGAVDDELAFETKQPSCVTPRIQQECSAEKTQV